MGIDENPLDRYGSWDDYNQRKRRYSEKIRDDDYEKLIYRLVISTEEGIPHKAQAIAYELDRRRKETERKEHPDEGYYGGPPCEHGR